MCKSVRREFGQQVRLCGSPAEYTNFHFGGERFPTEIGKKRRGMLALFPVATTPRADTRTIVAAPGCTVDYQCTMMDVGQAFSLPFRCHCQPEKADLRLFRQPGRLSYLWTTCSILSPGRSAKR